MVVVVVRVGGWWGVEGKGHLLCRRVALDEVRPNPTPIILPSIAVFDLLLCASADFQIFLERVWVLLLQLLLG